MSSVPKDLRKEMDGKKGGLEGRVLLGELIRGGIEPTPQLVDDVLYEGRIHSIAAPTGTGKTIIAEFLCLQVMHKGRPVLYLDAENGPKVIAERLQEMGADLDELDRLFHYYPGDLTLEPDSIADLTATVDDVQPALVVFDSLADFLGMAGLEENSNTDFTRWTAGIMQPLKDMEVASLLLDHTPKGGQGPRGASSKGAKVDVQWELEVSKRFDRERTGEIELTTTKDRECWLPKIVRFSIGGGVFARSYGTIEQPHEDTKMTQSASTIFDAVKKAGGEGARWTDLLHAAGESRGTVQRGLAELLKREAVLKYNGRYYLCDHEGAVPPEERENPLSKANSYEASNGTARYREGTAVPPGTSETVVVPLGTSPLIGEVPTGTTDAEPAAKSGRRLTDEQAERVKKLIHEGMKPALARAEVLGTDDE